jgi:broad specificity phosphatase PhoE
MNLYCVRHGETEFNAAGRIQGQLDSALSQRGYQQCAATAAALAEFPIDAIFSSPLQRAAESARVIAERLQLPIRPEPRFMEINAGIFQGRCWPEIEAEFPAETLRWRSQDPDFCIPGGESRRFLMERTLAAVTEIAQQDLQHVVIVAHGGSLAALLKALLEVPARRNPFVLQNASISHLTLKANEVKLLTLNQTTHLKTLAHPGGEL